ncbi:hypothetical protein, partial [Klebsiella pneumoniae]|uniref:hypothetical protein n=1 Tax=Klebsiella pneumoniae TaxID=573 RepID=UPI001562DF82
WFARVLEQLEYVNQTEACRDCSLTRTVAPDSPVIAVPQRILRHYYRPGIGVTLQHGVENG